METTYCWRCDRDVAMFDEHEWSRLAPLLQQGIESIKSYRTEHQVDLSQVPFADLYAEALREHEQITGDANVRPQDI